MQDKKQLLSSLPKVDILLENEKIKKLCTFSRNMTLESIRQVLDLYRSRILSGEISSLNVDDIVNDIVRHAENKSRPHLRRVINATGTVLHTNLGRSVLSKEAVNAVINASAGYNNLEFDLEKGIRGSRYSHVEEIICKITGAEAALVVNNNAAAVMLALSTLAKGKEAIVSRGQLVEIGGSFRIPAVMELSGAHLVEVGTTNRTHLYDYEKAINENTGVILKVHQSNYKILGFTEEVELKELIELGNKSAIPVIEDIGSGVFIDFSKYGLAYEPTVQKSLEDGVDIITFSGDKMLGGPQAGIIAGRKKYIDQMKKNQLTRALRIDKMTLAALEATLRLYIDESAAISKIPALKMLTVDQDTLRKNARKLSVMLKNRIGSLASIEVKNDYSQVGGGSMPLEKLNTYVVAVKPFNMSLDMLDYRLRTCDTPITARIFKDRMLFDVRTIFDNEYKIISDALSGILGE